VEIVALVTLEGIRDQGSGLKGRDQGALQEATMIVVQRYVWFGLALLAVAACQSRPPADAARSAPAPAAADPAHKGVVGPHGDHTAHHGGLVLMNGDVHYEVVFAKDGRHQVWFSDAVRSELPASVATGVTMSIARPSSAVEEVVLAIDDAGEAWVARARPLEGSGTVVKLRYSLQGEPHEIDIPVVAELLR
jgi:hypothetical protein